MPNELKHWILQRKVCFQKFINSHLIKIKSFSYIHIISEHQSLIDELNRMSLTSTTLRIKNRRNEIEKMLNKLDETIETFSRPTVYVKIN